MKIKSVKYILKPCLEPNFDGHKFKFIERLWTFYVNSKPVDVPIDFWTDFASTGIITPLDETLYPALSHDWLYYKQKLFGKPIKKSTADLIFLIAMKECKVGIIKRRLYYWAVKYSFTAKKTWNKYKNDRSKNEN